VQGLLCCCILDINPMALKLKGNLDILKMYLHTKNVVARSRYSKLLTVDGVCMVNEKYANNSQGQSHMSPTSNHF